MCFSVVGMGMMVSINVLHQELILSGKNFSAIYRITLLHNAKGVQYDSSMESH